MAVCRSVVTDAPLLRIESQVEQLGDLQFDCDANTNAPLDVTVTLSVPVATPFAGATLQVSSPPAAYTPILDGPNRVRFIGVVLPPGAASVRITGLRANVSGLAYALAATPPAVLATVTSPGNILAASQVPVGYPTPSYSIALRTIDGRPTTVLNLAASAAQRTHEIVFLEGFVSAFRTRARDAQASQGTRLVAHFTNLPPGATIAVAPFSNGSGARLTATESGPYSPLPFAGYETLPVVNGGATAVWEVIAEDPTRQDIFDIGIIASGPSTSATVTGRLGPVDETSIPRFKGNASLHPNPCTIYCVVPPNALYFTHRFGQPAPAVYELPYWSNIGRGGLSIGMRVFTESDVQWLSGGSINGLVLSFSVGSLPPGRYSAYAEINPGGARMWIILTVTPPLPGEDTPPLCVPIPPVPVVLRAEGVTEPLPAIVVECNGGVPGSYFSGRLRGTLNSLYSAIGVNSPSRIREALLIVGEPANPIPDVDLFTIAKRSNFQFEVTFGYRVPSDRRMRFRMRNLRTSGEYLARHVNSHSPPKVELELSSLYGFAMVSTVLTLGTIQRGLEFAVHASDGQPIVRVSNLGQYQLRFREGYPAAFRRRNSATTVDNPTALADQTAADNDPATETMYYSAALGETGLALHGTRLNARFSGIPSTARLLVTLQNLPSSTSNVRARLRPAGFGSFSPFQSSGETFVFDGVPHAVAELPVIDPVVGSRDANWEVLGADPSQLEELRFGVVLLSTAPVSPVSVAGRFSPLQSSVSPVFKDIDLTQRRFCTNADCIFYDYNSGEVRFDQRPDEPAVQFRYVPVQTNGPTIRYVATSDAPWLTIVAPVGQLPTQLPVTTDTTGLAVGVHRATVRFNDVPISIKLTVHPVAAPIITTDPPSAPNRRTFRVTARDQTHPFALGIVNVLINSALDGGRACYLAYSYPAGVLYLVNDQGPDAGLSAPLVLGAPGEVANSQCRIHGATSSAVRSAVGLLLTLDVSFTPGFTGSKVVYAATRTVDQASSGWSVQDALHLPESEAYPRALGALQVRQVGHLSAMGIAFTYEDATDANNLETVWGLINTGIDARGACYFAYYVPGNLLFLYPDDGNGVAAQSIPLYGNRSISNSQCSILSDWANVEKSGKQLRLTIPFQFPYSFNSEKGVWGAAKSLNNPQASPWRILGAARHD